MYRGLKNSSSKGGAAVINQYNDPSSVHRLRRALELGKVGSIEDGIHVIGDTQDADFRGCILKLDSIELTLII